MFATAASIPGHRFAATAFFSDKFATAAADDRVAAAGNIAAGDRVAAAAVGTFFWFSFTSDECLISFTAIFDTLSFGHH